MPNIFTKNQKSHFLSGYDETGFKLFATSNNDPTPNFLYFPLCRYFVIHPESPNVSLRM